MRSPHIDVVTHIRREWDIGNAVPNEVPIMPKKPMKVYLTTQQHILLTNIAKREEISRSEVLRNALLKYAYLDGTASERQRLEKWMSKQ